MAGASPYRHDFEKPAIPSGSPGFFVPAGEGWVPAV